MHMHFALCRLHKQQRAVINNNPTAAQILIPPPPVRSCCDLHYEVCACEFVCVLPRAVVPRKFAGRQLMVINCELFMLLSTINLRANGGARGCARAYQMRAGF